MLTDFISEYEFSGTMDAGNIRDRIEKPMPLLKKRSLVNLSLIHILFASRGANYAADIIKRLQGAKTEETSE